MKKITTTMILVLQITGIAAQTQYRNEWRIHAAVGISTFQFSSEALASEIANSKGGFGGNAGVEYAYFFSRYFGFSAGAEVAMYNNAITSPNTVNTETLIETPAGLTGNFFFRTQYEDIKETQTAIFLQLPLKLHLQIPISSKNYIYIAAGGKYGIPLTATCEQTIGTRTTSGYSEDFKETITNAPQHGFETVHDVHTTEKLALKSLIIPTAEAGFKWNNHLYTAAYIDMNHAIGIKIAYAFGFGERIEPPKKPQPLWGY
ncbi:hypothetical protein SAMD00024442_17_18 [Candidatus Symbiothrix dinenymphae]|nr:hypothetical protein SAMD00024442_17_18 [Candidatus Symbiothrix dinenymphae]